MFGLHAGMAGNYRVLFIAQRLVTFNALLKSSDSVRKICFCSSVQADLEHWGYQIHLGVIEDVLRFVVLKP